MSNRFPGAEDDDLGPPPPPFRIDRRRPELKSFGNLNRWIGVAVFLLVLFIVLNVAKGLYVDWLWFDGAGFRSVYATRLTTQIYLFLGGAAIFLGYFGFNVFLAGRLAVRNPVPGLSDEEAAAIRRLILLALVAGTIFLAVIFGAIAAGKWDIVLRFLNRESFGIEDPQFGKDVGFYVFTLPGLRAAYGWLMGAAVITTVIVAALYLFRYITSGADASAVRQTKIHLSALLVAVIALFIWRYWLNTFEINFSETGVVFGAAYTDIHARLVFLYVGMALGVITAAVLLISMIRGTIMLPIGAMIGWALIAIVGGAVYPASVQRLTVLPNELEKERQYIERNIEMTRIAFGLNEIEERPYPAEENVSDAEINAEENAETLGNIRLLDVRPLLQTYNQIQTIRPLYQFLDVDIDRYVIDGVRRQVMVSARELSPSLLPVEAQSWVNQRLQFTHGYGAVVSPVNEVVQEGLPDILFGDIPVNDKTAEGDFNVTRPEIYYGEQPDHYVIVKTSAQEFNYPVGDGNVQTVFEGDSGVGIGNIFRKLVFAWEFQDFNILISSSLGGDSRILWRRNIQERINTLAPFLTLDEDPYLVIVDGQFFWIQDAYTTTDRFPYSQPAPAGYNYVRNSVKVVVNAYDGTTTLYLNDDSDPIIRSYARIFPKLFTPLDEMPTELREHLRYPEDLFLAQVNQYRTYHIQDPGVLYNKEDIWSIPRELFEDTEVLVEPYYVIMRLPGEDQAEFILILPLTPARRENTIAWVAARSDEPNLGKLLSFRFPTDSLVFGPRQIESRIDQDTAISGQFSLWNQSGSRVIRGNLLMIPIGNGIIFVEPIYLQAETSQLPELKRVIVVNGNEIAMEETLQESLEVIFGGAAPTLPSLDPTGSPQPTTTQPTATPSPAGPTPTPSTSGPPSTLSELAAEASAAFERAQEALRAGDFATYGDEIAQVELLIQQIVELSE